MTRLIRQLSRSPTLPWFALLACVACGGGSQGDDDTPGDDDSAGPRDADGDGFDDDVDCDDGDTTVYPGAEELCDGLDNDCNGAIDDDQTDTDEDGFADCVDPTPDGFDGAADRESPLSAQLHLHGSLSEFDGTMACHTHWAETYGVDVLWWSDHDTTISMVQRPYGFDFDNGALLEDIELVGATHTHGFEELEVTLDPFASSLVDGGPSGSGYYWSVEGQPPPESTGWSVARFAYNSAGGSIHRMPLMSVPTVGLWIRTQQAAAADWELLLTVTLSSNCDGTVNQITYYHGINDLSAYSSDTRLYVPLTIPWQGLWTEVELHVADDAAYFPQGDDQSATAYEVELRVRDSAHAIVQLDDLAFSWEREKEELRQYQRTVLDERYSDGAVVHFVGQEITLVEGGQHINAFGAEQTPLLDHLATGVIRPEEATEHVHDAGALAMCNHPFGTKIGIQYEGEDADLQTELLTEEYLNTGAYDCDLMEVGYVARGVDLEHYLRFWDNLSVEGLYLTGTGTSDHHWGGDWLDFANPFVTWVFLDVPAREAIAGELGSGRAFFGDPGPFVGHDALLDLWSEHGAVMGDILESDLDQVVHVQTGYLEGGWTLELVVDGEVHESLLLAGDETDSVFELPRGAIRAIRAQLLDEEGEAILVSNPLYLAMPD